VEHDGVQAADFTVDVHMPRLVRTERYRAVTF
jgi:hypothetical protein